MSPGHRSAAPATRALIGRDGLARLSGSSTVSAPDPDGFRGRRDVLRLAHVRIEVLAASAHRSERGPEQILHRPDRSQTFLLVLAGSLRVEVVDVAFDLSAGELLLVDEQEPYTWTTEQPVRALRSSVRLDRLPAVVRDRGTTVPMALLRTPMADAFIGSAAAAMRAAAAGGAGDGFSGALADLQIAVLAEAQQLMDERRAPVRLRHRMAEYIESHLSDPDLDAGAVAAAIGIGVGHAHDVFRQEGRSIARSIRDRRIAAVAVALLGCVDPPPLGALAARFGFADEAAMVGAFQQRTGRSPVDLWRSERLLR